MTRPPSLFALVMLTLAIVVACTPAATPRERARSVVVTIAEGVRQADFACARAALELEDVSLADACDELVGEARASLLTAERGIDAWDSAAAGEVPCATARAADALSRLLGIVRRAGARPPPAVEDALRLAPMLTGGCHAS